MHTSHQILSSQSPPRKSAVASYHQHYTLSGAPLSHYLATQRSNLDMYSLSAASLLLDLQLHSDKSPEDGCGFVVHQQRCIRPVAWCEVLAVIDGIAHKRKKSALGSNRRRLNQGHRPPKSKPMRQFCFTRGPPRKSPRCGDIKRCHRSRRSSDRHRWSGARGHSRSAGLGSRCRRRGVPFSRLAEDMATAAAYYIGSRQHRKSSHYGPRRSTGISARYRNRHIVADGLGHLLLLPLLSSRVCHLQYVQLQRIYQEYLVDICEVSYHGEWGANHDQTELMPHPVF